MMKHTKNIGLMAGTIMLLMIVPTSVYMVTEEQKEEIQNNPFQNHNASQNSTSDAVKETKDITIKNQEEIKLGYCPTMEKYAFQLREKNNNFKLIHYGSSSESLCALNAGNTDVALIGRVAKSHEIQSNAVELRMREGYTLISNKKKFINFQSLNKVNIHTNISEEESREILPNANIIHYATLQEAIANGIHEAVLINWNDYKDEFELLIPVENGEKIALFRVPTLYYYNLPDEFIKSIKINDIN